MGKAALCSALISLPYFLSNLYKPEWNYIIQWCGNPWNCIGSFLFFFPHNSRGIVLWYRAKVEMRQRLLFTLDPKVPGLSGECDRDKHQVHLYILLTAAFPTTHSALAIKHDYRCCITSSSVTLNPLNPTLNPKLKLTQEWKLCYKLFRPFVCLFFCLYFILDMVVFVCLLLKR